jgi:hypothetical protein
LASIGFDCRSLSLDLRKSNKKNRCLNCQRFQPYEQAVLSAVKARTCG